MKYFIWGNDYLGHMPSGDFGDLEFGGFIQDQKTNQDCLLSQEKAISFKNFLRYARQNKTILVFYFNSIWAWNYLAPSLETLKDKFQFQIMDIYDFCIEYDLTLTYETLKNTKKEILARENDWLVLSESMTDEYSKKSIHAYIESFKKNHSKFLLSVIQPSSLEVFNKHSNHFSFLPSDDEVYVDIGAYTGDTVLKFIEATPTGSYKKIHAFEPNPEVYPQLSEMKNWLRNFETYQVALSDKAGEVGFLQSSMGSRISSEDKPVKNTIMVKSLLLDDLISEASFIKIDVEGFEAEVISGGRSLIEKCRPNLVVDTYHYPNDILKIYETVMKIHPYKYVSWRMSHLRLHSLYFSDKQSLS